MERSTIESLRECGNYYFEHCLIRHSIERKIDTYIEIIFSRSMDFIALSYV